MEEDGGGAEGPPLYRGRGRPRQGGAGLSIGGPDVAARSPGVSDRHRRRLCRDPVDPRQYRREPVPLPAAAYNGAGSTAILYRLVGVSDPAGCDCDRLRCDQRRIQSPHSEPGAGAADLPRRSSPREIPRRAGGARDRPVLAVAVDDRSRAVAPPFAAPYRRNCAHAGGSRRDDRLWRGLAGRGPSSFHAVPPPPPPVRPPLARTAAA